MGKWKSAVAAAALVCAATAPAAAQLIEGVAAVVNDDVISTYDVRQRALLLLASNGIEATPENQQRAQQQALRDLVDERLQMQEAHAFEVQVTQEQVDRQIGEIARANQMTAEQFQQQLASVGIGLATLRRQIEAETAWRRIINGRYGSRVRISETRITETQQRIASSATRTQYLAGEIFLPASSAAEFQEAEATAVRLLQEMQRGAAFPLVARQFSAAATAAAGGDLGWTASGELRPEVQAALDRLQPGQVSTPFRTQDGVYIVALRERREGGPTNAVERVTLRQIVGPAAQQAQIERARARIANCEDMQSALTGVAGVEIVELGSAAVNELSQSVQDQIRGLQAGQTTAVSIAGDQAAAIVVCGRETNTTGMPSRTEIENRLYEQELAMLAQRYLRNLRREATIITPQQ